MFQNLKRKIICACIVITYAVPVIGQSGNDYSMLTYADKNGNQKTVKSRKQWETKRKQILDRMQTAMGLLPDKATAGVLKATFSDSLKTDKYTRYTVVLQIAKGEQVTAYYYLPTDLAPNTRVPAILALHPTGSLGKDLIDGKNPMPNRSYGKELAERGYIVLAPDFPGYGSESNYNFQNDRYESGSMKGIFNHIRCTDFLVSRSEVDSDNLGVIGHSLGGYNAIFVGAFEPRLKAVVSSSGWTLFDYYHPSSGSFQMKHEDRLAPWAKDVHMPLLREKFKLDKDLIPFDLHEAIASMAPRAFFTNSPEEDYFTVEGVKKGIAAIRQVYKLYHAEDKVQAVYPKGGHNFPTEQRNLAYQFFDKVLGHNPKNHYIE